jgi:pyridoxal phosphate enzyme (YggS family)
MPSPDLSGRRADLLGQIADAVHRGGHRQHVTVVAVTKTQSVATIEAAVAAGFRDIGENKIQEALSKQAEIRLAAERDGSGSGHWGNAVRWHLIGHLQRNKVKHLTAFHLFHALDSARLADAVEAMFGGEAGTGARLRVLIQVNIAGETTKGGYQAHEIGREAERLMKMRALEVVGVMTMAPLGADEATLRAVFGGARMARDVLRQAGHRAEHLSMGMSQDFVTAVEEGATLVRLGTVLFGERTA